LDATTYVWPYICVVGYSGRLSIYSMFNVVRLEELLALVSGISMSGSFY
jgi:hypothetical protein